MISLQPCTSTSPLYSYSRCATCASCNSRSHATTSASSCTRTRTGKRIDEQSNHPLHAAQLFRTPTHRRSINHFLAPAVAAQQQPPRALQYRVQRQLLPPRQLLQTPAQLCRQLQLPPPARSRSPISNARPRTPGNGVASSNPASARRQYCSAASGCCSPNQRM